jgi:hypothetical protein
MCVFVCVVDPPTLFASFLAQQLTLHHPLANLAPVYYLYLLVWCVFGPRLAPSPERAVTVLLVHGLLDAKDCAQFPGSGFW